MFQPQLYAFQNDAIATRFAYQLYHEAIANEPNSPLASFPGDFELYYVGDFDTGGSLEPRVVPLQVLSFNTFKEV